jgi:hypothetical protein
MASGMRREEFQKTAASGHMLTFEGAIVTNADAMVGCCGGEILCMKWLGWFGGGLLVKSLEVQAICGTVFSSKQQAKHSTGIS